MTSALAHHGLQAPLPQTVDDWILVAIECVVVALIVWAVHAARGGE
jgi:hypothetical protein